MSHDSQMLPQHLQTQAMELYPYSYPALKQLSPQVLNALRISQMHFANGMHVVLRSHPEQQGFSDPPRFMPTAAFAFEGKQQFKQFQEFKKQI